MGGYQRWLVAFGMIACSSSETAPSDPTGPGSFDASPDAPASEASIVDSSNDHRDAPVSAAGGAAGAISGSAVGGAPMGGGGGSGGSMSGVGGTGGMGTGGAGGAGGNGEGGAGAGASGAAGAGGSGGSAGAAVGRDAAADGDARSVGDAVAEIATADAAGDADASAMPCPQPDADGDGYRSVACGGNDCNDNDPAIHPYAADDWDVQVVEHTTFASPNYALLATAIGITSTGAVHIVRRVDAELYDFTNETGSWIGTRVTAGPASYPVVAVDSSDVVRIAFGGASDTAIATRVNATTWTTSSIDSSQGIPGLTVSPSGVLHAAYAAAGELRHASNGTGSWSHETLPTLASAGLSPAFAPSVIAIDKNGALHVAYQEHYSTGRIPSYTVESVSNASGSWVAANVGQGEKVSQSIAAATAGGFHGAAVVELGIGRDTDLIYFGSAAGVLPKRVEPNILSTAAIAVAGGRVHVAHAAQESELRVPPRDARRERAGIRGRRLGSRFDRSRRHRLRPEHHGRFPRRAPHCLSRPDRC